MWLLALDDDDDDGTDGPLSGAGSEDDTEECPSFLLLLEGDLLASKFSTSWHGRDSSVADEPAQLKQSNLDTPQQQDEKSQSQKLTHPF